MPAGADDGEGWRVSIPARGQLDPFEFARQLFDKLREYIDERNAHRREAIDTMGHTLADCERDLARGTARPGWVALTFDQHREDIDEIRAALGEDGWVRKAFNANAEAISAQNKKLNAIFVAVGLMLLGLLGNLIAIILGAYQ